MNNLDAGDYFKLLAALMKDNPPAKGDAPMVARLAKIGIVPDKDFDIGNSIRPWQRGLEKAAKPALEKIVAHMKDAGKAVNGWVYATRAASTARTTSSEPPSPTIGCRLQSHQGCRLSDLRDGRGWQAL